MLGMAIGGVLILIGAVWFLQGIGVLPGSFMTGSAFWAVTGAVFVSVGVATILRARRRAGPSDRSPPEN